MNRLALKLIPNNLKRLAVLRHGGLVCESTTRPIHCTMALCRYIVLLQCIKSTKLLENTNFVNDW